MKKIVLFSALIFSLKGLAQQPIHAKDMSHYCVDLQDGILVLTENDQPVEGEVLLRDSSIISRAGVVTKKNGSSMTLKQGECIDQDGNFHMHIVTPERKEGAVKNKK